MPECDDCVEHPVWWVRAQGPDRHAAVRCCGAQRCIDYTRRWVEQTTGVEATMTEIGVTEVA